MVGAIVDKAPAGDTRRLAGKVGLVTGDARGIGAAICKRLTEQGAHVAFTYSRSAAQAHELVADIEAQGGRAVAFASDSGDAAANAAIADQVVATLGRLDIVVHNSGFSIIRSTSEFTPEDFDRLFSVNVRGVLLITQAALPHLSSGSRIIIIGSIVSDRTPFMKLALYASSKTALIGLNKGMARDLGPLGITVNMIEPGPVNTDMNPADGVKAPPHIELMAIDRYGEADEVASLVAFVAGPDSALITGARLAVDGGFSI